MSVMFCNTLMTFILCNISEMQIELFDIAVDGHCTL